MAQARNFNEAFGSTRRLDGFIISKVDTVGDMMGYVLLSIGRKTCSDLFRTLVSMVHATGIPVLFLGTGMLQQSSFAVMQPILKVSGQHYSDLRSLNISHVVSLLMT